MIEFKKKEKYHFWHSPLALSILFLILVFFAYNMIGLIEKERETSKQKEISLTKLDNLKNREQTLTNDISKIKTEEGIETAIREKYQVAKAGEKMVQIVDDNTTASVSTDSAGEHGFVSFLKRLFVK